MNYTNILLTSVCFTQVFCYAQSAPERWNGTSYNQYSQPQMIAGRALIKNIIFQGTEWVLDVGCGTANLAAEIAGQLPEGAVIGVDCDASMVAQARAQYAHRENLAIQHIPAQMISYEDRFDYAISVFCLHWIPKEDLALVMQRIARSLKPGGRFLALMSLADHPTHPVKQMRAGAEMIADPKWNQYYHYGMPLANGCCLQDYKDAIDAAGLIGTVGLREQPPLVVSSEQCKNFYRQLPFTQHIPDELQEEFLEEYLTKLAAHGLQNEDDTFSMSWTNGLVDVTKPLA